MKKIYFLLLLLFPTASMCDLLNYPDIMPYFGVDAHMGRIGVKKTEIEPTVVVAPANVFIAPLNHKVYTHVTFNAGLMFNDYVGLEAGKSFSKGEFHKRSGAKSKINFVYIGPIIEYKVREIEGFSLIGTVAIANFDAKINDAYARKSSLRLSIGGKYMLNKDFGVRAGTIFHQTSKLKTKSHAASNGVHYMAGLTCNF